MYIYLVSKCTTLLGPATPGPEIAAFSILHNALDSINDLAPDTPEFEALSGAVTCRRVAELKGIAQVALDDVRPTFEVYGINNDVVTSRFLVQKIEVQ